MSFELASIAKEVTMTQPIYLSFRMKAKEPWHQLTGDEQNAKMAQINASLEAVGVESIVLCDCT